MKKILILCLVVLAGCISKGIDLKTRFNPQEVAYILGPGEGKIQGRAFLVADGQIHKAVGQQVVLVPISSYSIERMQAIYGSGNTQRKNINTVFTNPDPAYAIYQKKTAADFDGNFDFVNVPDGNYFVATRVIWGSGVSDNAAIRKNVSVTGGNTQVVVIDGN